VTSNQTDWPIGVYVVMSLGVLALTAIGLWGAYESVQTNRRLLRRAAFTQLRAQALQRAGHIETGIAAAASDASAPIDSWEVPWLRRYWQGVELNAPGQLYAALVGNDGVIRYHNDAAFVGRTLQGRWYLDRVEDGDGDIVVIDAKVLNDDHQAYDIEVPVTVGGKAVAYYHAGVAKAWLDRQLADQTQAVVYRWATITVATVASAIVAMLAIRVAVRRADRLQEEARLARKEREAQLGVLAAGLAHEVRNPLHAIRLNLNTLETLAQPDAADGSPPSESSEVLEATKGAVKRIDHLVQELLNYAKPAAEHPQRFDAVGAVSEVVDLLRRELSDACIEATIDAPSPPVWVQFEPSRLRQILVNLLLNARDAQPEGGTIVVEVRPDGRRTRIAVTDEGVGIPPEDVDRLFEPFFTTKETGTGFGLALTKRYLRKHGGFIRYEPQGTGARFVIDIPSAEA